MTQSKQTQPTRSAFCSLAFAVYQCLRYGYLRLSTETVEAIVGRHSLIWNQKNEENTRQCIDFIEYQIKLANTLTTCERGDSCIFRSCSCLINI